VYDVELPPPVIHAKARRRSSSCPPAAHEFGIGAAGLQTDYDGPGMTYDSPGTRISRLRRGTQIIKSMWVNERTTSPATLQVTNIARAVEGGTKPPKILIGGGGPPHPEAGRPPRGHRRDQPEPGRGQGHRAHRRGPGAERIRFT